MRPAAPTVAGLNGVAVVRGGLAHPRYGLSDASFTHLTCRLFVTQYGVTRLSRSLGSQPVGQTLSVALRVSLKPGVSSWRVKATDAVGTSS
jgi:hypothetical protein